MQGSANISCSYTIEAEMDFTKTRCAVCFKHFCCPAHRSEHQVKIHTETFAEKHHPVQVFQKNARTSLFWAQNNQKINEILKQSQVRQVSTVPLRLPVSKNIQLPSIKRLHSAIDKRILSTSVTTIVSQQRRILVPVHRLELPNVLKDDTKEVSLKDSNEVSKEPSSYVDKSVKTSTPILSPLPSHQPSQMMWDISSESTISNYQTPSGPSPGSKTETNQLNVKPSKNQVMVTPLRGIILKSSKYDSDSDSGPSPAINSSRSRRVTFSSSSQVSSTSSPLESIQEVEIYEEIENTYNHIEDISAKTRSRRTEDTESEKFTKNRKVLEDSTPPIQHNGFLSCVTNMFCSAIYTIPSLAPWRKTDENDLMLNRSKRSRSPDARETHYLDVGTPLLKRPCYPSDLRKNPIQSRRPIYKR